MSNLLKLHPEFRVVLPEGASGGTGKLEYQGVYKVAAMLAGASTRIKVIIPDRATPRLGKIVNVTNNGDVLVLGALMGDPLPPYVTLTIYPTLASGKADPIPLEGRPHEHPAGSGFWDLHDIGEDPNGPVVTSREQQINLLSATAAANEAAGKVTAEVTRWNAEQQGVQSWKADLEADIAQQQETLAAQIEGTALPPWVVTQNQPEYVEIMAILPGAYQTPTITLPNTGVSIPTVEIDV